MTSACLYIMGPQFTQLKHCAWNIGKWGEFARECREAKQAMDGIAPAAGAMPGEAPGSRNWRGFQVECRLVQTPRVDGAFPSTSGAMSGLVGWTGEAWSTLRLEHVSTDISS